MRKLLRLTAARATIFEYANDAYLEPTNTSHNSTDFGTNGFNSCQVSQLKLADQYLLTVPKCRLNNRSDRADCFITRIIRLPFTFTLGRHLIWSNLNHG